MALSTDDQPVDQRLQLSEERLRLALEAAELGTWDYDPAQQIVTWDERCRELFGVHEGTSITYQEKLTHVYPDDRAAMEHAMHWAMNPRSQGHFDLTFRTTDGQLRWLHSRGRAYFDAAGVAYRFTGVSQNITREVIARQEQYKLLALVENSADVMAIDDGKGKLLYLNQTGYRLTGLEWGEHHSLPTTMDFYSPDFVETFRQQALPLLEKDQRWSGTIPMRHFKTEELIPCHADVMLIRDPATGQILGRGVTARDLRPERAARQALQESERNLRNLVMEAPMSIAILRGSDLVVELANSKYLRLMGRSRTELVGKPLWEALPEGKDQGFDALLRGVMSTGIPYHANEYELRVKHQELVKTRYVSFTYQPRYEDGGHISGVIVIAVDVTSQVTARQKIQESGQRLEQQVAIRTQELENINQELVRSNEALEHFAYVASHDLQEPLRKIESFGNLLQRKQGDRLDATGQDYLVRMQTAARRMAGMIDDLLSYSRLTTKARPFTPVNLNAVVAQVIEMLEQPIQESQARIELQALPMVSGDRSQLQQLFQNLLSNALKFRKASVPPTVRFSHRVVEGREVPGQGASSGRFYAIEVADEGIGFEEQYREKIFGMFQRLHGKAEYAGTGLGLALCLKIAQNHGGTMEARSQPGQGAAFTVYLPA